ncbi:hypothetical protein [Spirosoma arcticum]
MIPPKPLTQPLPARPANQPSAPFRALAQPLWAWAVVLLPVIVFALVWQYYAVNVPKWDDHALRAYLYFSDQETTLSGKIYQLFRQHNEHRIVYDRIIATLDYRLFGKMSHIHLMVAGNLSLVGLLAVFGAVLLRAGKSLIYLLPVALLLFNLSHWENMFWGMAALQNFSVVLWVVLTIYLLSYTDRWGLALVAAVLATLTSGNGLLVWPIGLILLMLRTPTVNRQRSEGAVDRPKLVLLAWVVAAAAIITLYFIGFEKPAGNPANRPSITELLKGWLAFTGAAAEVFSTESPLRVSTWIGMLMVLATLGRVSWDVRTYWPTITNAMRFVFRSGYEKPVPEKSGHEKAGRQKPGLKKPVALHSDAGKALPPMVLFFWGCALFILATAALVAWTRTGFGIDLIITSRYKVYSLTLLALLYVYVVGRLPKRAGRWMGAVGAVGAVASLFIAWLSYNLFLDDTIWWRHWMLTSQFNWTYSTSQPVRRLDAINKQYIKQAPAFYDADPAVLYGAGQPTVWPVAVTQTPDGFLVQDGNGTAQDQRDSRAFVVARSPKRTYLFPTRQNQNLAGRKRYWPANPFTVGFTATRGDVDLDSGTYQLFILTVATNGQLTLYPTGQSITWVKPAETPLKKNW